MTTDLCTFAIKIDVNHDRAYIGYVAFKSDGLDQQWESAPHESRQAAVNETADFIRRRFLSHQLAYEVIHFDGVPQQ